MVKCITVCITKERNLIDIIVCFVVSFMNLNLQRGVIAMMLQKSPVTENLMVLDIEPKSFSDQFAQFRDASGLMYIKGCRRDVLIGSEHALQDAPNPQTDGITLYRNADAYAHLLTYVTGLISRTRGESQIVSQFKRAYSELQTRASEQAVDLHRLFRNIINDNSVVRNNVTPSLKPAFYEACAHELSNQNGQDVVLIVVNTHPNGKPDAETENMVRYLAGNKRQSAKTIVFTHPDPNHLRTVYGYFLSQQTKGKLTSPIEMLPFEQAFDANSDLQRFDKAFVCLPMGRCEEVDMKIIEEWRQKEAFGGTLIHLGGSKKTDRISKGAWQNLELWSYVSPEKIIQHQSFRKQQNEDTIAEGKKACNACAQIRSQGRRPNSRVIEPIMKVA